VRIGLRGERRSNGDSVVIEAVVAPHRAVQGETIASLPLGRRLGIRVLAAHRHNHIAGPELGKVRLKAADKLLIEGPADAFDELASETALVSVSRPSGRAYRRAKAPVALLTLAAVVILAAAGVMDIGALAMIAVAFILLVRCIDAVERSSRCRIGF
jgi:TrkA-C domain